MNTIIVLSAYYGYITVCAFHDMNIDVILLDSLTHSPLYSVYTDCLDTYQTINYILLISSYCDHLLLLSTCSYVYVIMY